MKLVEILARELKEWPNADGQLVKSMSQDGDREVSHYNDKIQTFHDDSWGASIQGYIPCSRFEVSKLASDYKTAIVTRADWEAERARIAKPASKANKDGWIRHRGGKCPVEAGVLVEVKRRDGKIEVLSELDINNVDETWLHVKDRDDIMRYRIHKPAEQPAANAKPCLEIKFPENPEEVLESLKTGPLQWRDRIHEIDRTIEALEEERVSLIQRLESEGLQLLQAKVCGSVQPIEDMSDWRNWKAGDLLECLTSEYKGVYEKGKVYEVKAVLSQYAQVIDDCGVGSCCSINDSHRTKFKFHSRPQS